MKNSRENLGGSTRAIDSVVVHHTGSRILRDFDSPLLVKLRHRFLKGWDNVGYHYLIGNGRLTEDGKIYDGRPIEMPGAHAFGHNKNSIGIAMIGNFDHSKPTDKQMATLSQLLVKLCGDYGLGADAIRGHRELEYAKTACPGKYVDMDSVRTAVTTSLPSSVVRC